MIEHKISTASPFDETARLAELRSLDILNTSPEERESLVTAGLEFQSLSEMEGDGEVPGHRVKTAGGDLP